MQKNLKKIAIITIAMLRENRGLIAGLVGENPSFSPMKWDERVV